LPVEEADTGVVGEDQGDLGALGNGRQVRRAAGGERPVDQGVKLRRRRPAIGLDQDIGGDCRGAGSQIPSPGVRSGLS
jgi:hypothetical protein